MGRCAGLVAMFALAVTVAIAADWPGYLGPTHDAVSSETGLARSWPETGPPVLWSFPLDRGYGGAAVSAGRVYVMGREDRKKDVLHCLDLATGEELWSYAYDAPGRLSHPGGRSVPAVDGNRIYIAGPFGHLHCLSLETHRPLWSLNYWTQFGGGRLPMWALSQNPLVYGDMVIVAPQTRQAAVAAFDKMTGAVRWTSDPLPSRTGYVSPCVVTLAGEAHLVMISAGPSRRDLWGRRGNRGGGGRPAGAAAPAGQNEKRAAPAVKGLVIGLDPADGSLLWSYDGWQCQTPVPNVTEIGGNRLFITGGYKAGSVAIQVEKGDDGYTVTEVFRTDGFGSHVHPPVLCDGHLYGQCTTNTGRMDGLMCMDLDGNIKWKTGKKPFFDKGGMLLADGMIIALAGANGDLYLIEPSPEAFKPLATAEVLGTSQCWAPPALSDGRLLVRDQKQLVCVGLK